MDDKPPPESGVVMSRDHFKLTDCKSLAPQYLSELCVPFANVAGRRQLRSASRRLLYFPRQHVTLYGRRAHQLTFGGYMHMCRYRNFATSLSPVAEAIVGRRWRHVGDGQFLYDSCYRRLESNTGVRNTLPVRYWDLHRTYYYMEKTRHRGTVDCSFSTWLVAWTLVSEVISSKL